MEYDKIWNLNTVKCDSLFSSIIYMQIILF